VTAILTVAAGLFAGSYTYSMADPAPRSIPVAVVGEQGTRGGAFLAGMGEALNASLRIRPYRRHAAAVTAVEEQKVYAIFRFHGAGAAVTLEVSGASGVSVAELLERAAAQVGARTGVRVAVRDIRPLQPGDPRGLAVFYISLAAVIVGFVGATQLSIHARALGPVARTAATAVYALLGGLAIVATVDGLLGALELPFPESWLILALTMFASGMVFTMFNTLVGRWAIIPTWGLMVVIGNPSSGGAVSWPLLPSPLAVIGRWLPPGASVDAQHTAIYFPGHQHPFPFAVLAGWALVSCAVFWTWHHRHPGGREDAPPR